MSVDAFAIFRLLRRHMQDKKIMNGIRRVEFEIFDTEQKDDPFRADK